jgi:hypothetical protein
MSVRLAGRCCLQGRNQKDATVWLYISRRFISLIHSARASKSGEHQRIHFISIYSIRDILKHTFVCSSKCFELCSFVLLLRAGKLFRSGQSVMLILALKVIREVNLFIAYTAVSLVNLWNVLETGHFLKDLWRWSFYEMCLKLVSLWNVFETDQFLKGVWNWLLCGRG